MQTNAAFVAGLVAFIATNRPIHGEVPILAVPRRPVFKQCLRFAAGIGLPGFGVAQFFGVFLDLSSHGGAVELKERRAKLNERPKPLVLNRPIRSH